MSSDDHLETYYETYNEENVATKKHKHGRRMYYPSKPHCMIRNAVTGEVYPYKVGSFDQGRFYKIVDTTGTCDAEGYSISRREPTNPNPNHLFFESPEECMRHLRIQISPEEVEKWRSNMKERFVDYSAKEYYGEND